MNVLDLFSGIGGFSLGLERAGMRTVAFCEINPFCRRVLERHWPGVPIHPDIAAREFVAGEADVICGGFPCQDISLAGEGAGLAGDRSGLWRELLRAIRVVRPKFAIVENVAALLGRGMGTVLGDLASIGYDAEWHCIPASAVGAPHRRDRVWIIADARGEQHEGNRPPLSGSISAQLSQASPDANGIIGPQRGSGNSSEGAGGRDTGRSRLCKDVADAEYQGPSRSRRDAQCEGSVIEPCDHHSKEAAKPNWWSAEPDVGRVANGIPSRVDRLGGLGNAVVPQIPEIIGRAIMNCSFTEGKRA